MASKVDLWPKEFATSSTYAGTFTPTRSGRVAQKFGSVTVCSFDSHLSKSPFPQGTATFSFILGFE